LVPAGLLITYFDVGYMYLYFSATSVLLIVFLVLLWRSNSKKQFVWLHNILRFIIVSGVISILLIDIDLLINRLL
jgi:4-hydroxybenzoate polyprenyltransferase